MKKSNDFSRLAFVSIAFDGSMSFIFLIHSHAILSHFNHSLSQESYERAKSLLKTRSKELKSLAEALLKYETLDAEEVRSILEGKDLKRLRR